MHATQVLSQRQSQEASAIVSECALFILLKQSRFKTFHNNACLHLPIGIKDTPIFIVVLACFMLPGALACFMLPGAACQCAASQ